MTISTHPTVARVKERERPQVPGTLDASWLRRHALEAGADDVGFVEVGRPALAGEREDILRAFPRARSLVSYVVRMNREPIRSPARSLANKEFHSTGHDVDEVGRRLVQILEEQGIGAVSPSMGFPMEMDRFPGKIWVVSHKPVAVEAGLGRMGVHRNVIHPRFGNFILLGTVILEAELSEYDGPIEYNPCLECRLCVAACPVGAISKEGTFDFSACYTHNYREFMGGFTDWAEQVAESGSRKGYRKRVSDSESASMWQSLSYGANYKAAYCLSVCPAGEEVIGPFLDDRAGHLRRQVRPLREKEETVYVLRNSDAEDHVSKRFPSKTVRHVGNGLRPDSVRGFLDGLRLVFQPGKAGDLEARYHFRFTGREEAEATIVIAEGKLDVQRGLVGRADLRVTADANTWIGYLRGETSLVWALLKGRIRLWGRLSALKAFGGCFPRV